MADWKLSALGILRLLFCAPRGRLFLGQHIPEAIEPALPQRAARGDPVGGDAESAGLKATGTHTANLLCADDTAALEHLEMLNDRRQSHVEWLRQVADRCRPVAQLLDQLSSRRVAERVEDLIDCGLVKHVL